jgi:DNA-binding response OmpR family regulator
MEKLLIVDDNTEITQMLKEFMELVDFQVTVENDSKNGINLIETGNFDKIILDIAMPEFSGLDVLETLKTRNFTDFNKITILSASEIENKTHDKMISYGINGIAEKPINMTELVKKIRT